MTDLKHNLKLMMEATKPKVESLVERERNDLLKLYCYISINDLIPGKFQPRQYFDEKSMIDLANSIKNEGIIQPIIVRTTENKKYEIIAGERRWKAASMAGLKEIPAIIREINDESALAFGILENLQREDLNPIEEAEAFKKLIHGFSLTHEDVSFRVSKSRAYITNSIRLLNLPKYLQEALVKNDLQVGHAKAIASLESETQKEVFNQIINKKLSVRQAEMLSRKHLFPSSKKDANTKKNNESIAILEKDLSNKLCLPCKITLNANSSGKLEVSFNNIKELKRQLLED